MRKNTFVILVFILTVFCLVSCTGQKNVPSVSNLNFICAGYQSEYGPFITDSEIIYARLDITASWNIYPAISGADYETKIFLKKNDQNFREYTPEKGKDKFIMPKTDFTELATYTVTIEIKEKTKNLFFTETRKFKTIKPKKYEKETLWEFNYEKPEGASSPKLFDGVLYFITEKNFFALDPKTGKKLWSIQYSNNLESQSMFPLFDKEKKRAYFVQNTFFYCIDLNNRSIIYKTQLSKSCWYNAISQYRNEIYIPTESEGIFVVDPDSGKIKRYYYIDDEYIDPVGKNKLDIKLAFDGNIMYLPTFFTIFAIDISKGLNTPVSSFGYPVINITSEPGVKVWRYPEKEIDEDKLYRIGTEYGTPVIDENFLYVSGGFTIKFNKITGEVIWKTVNGTSGGPLIYGNTVICGGSQPEADGGKNDGVRALDKETGKVLWIDPTLATTGGTFGTYKNRIYVSDSWWNCMNPETGETYWYIRDGGYPKNRQVEIDEQNDLGYFSCANAYKVVCTKLDN